MIVEIWALTTRELRKWVKSRFILLSLVLRPLVWLVLFGKALSGAFSSSFISQGPQQQASVWAGAPDYFSFATPGILTLMIVIFSVAGANSLAFDRYSAFLDRLKVAPVRREAIVFAKVLAGTVKGLLQGAVMLVAAALIGFSVGASFGILQLIGVFLTLLLLGTILGSLFLTVSINVERLEVQEALFTSLRLPLVFTSNALYPISRMPEWLKPIAAVNPLTYAIDALRRFFFAEEGSQLLSDPILGFDLLLLGVSALFCLVLATVAARIWLD